jgi:hypothetical protein
MSLKQRKQPKRLEDCKFFLPYVIEYQAKLITLTLLIIVISIFNSINILFSQEI